MLEVMHQWHALIMTKSCGHGYMNKTYMLRASLMPPFFLLPTDWITDFVFLFLILKRSLGVQLL